MRAVAAGVTATCLLVLSGSVAPLETASGAVGAAFDDFAGENVG
ncbi:MAG: hypothetical protein ACRDGE_07005 [Candidatus Limnocylindria bacterium]